MTIIVVHYARVLDRFMQRSFTTTSCWHLAQQVVLVRRELRLMHADLVAEMVALTVLVLAIGHFTGCLDAALHGNTTAHHVLL